MNVLTSISRFMSIWYSPLVVGFAFVAYFFPSAFAGPAPYIPVLLGVVMLGMGLSIRVEDFTAVLKRPQDIAAGTVLQFTVMPLLGFAVARVTGVDPSIAAGFVLVGCVPCGTAANVMTFLSKGDVALSVTVCSVTTIVAPVVTPYLFLLFGGEYIPVHASAMIADILKIVVVPVCAGALVRRFFSEKAEKALRFVPIVSIVAIIVIVSAIVAVNATKLATMAGIVAAGVAVQNLCGYLVSYLAARFLCRMDSAKSRAVMFDTGMQNSGLGAALAVAHLTPVAALPSAVFSVWQNISGPILAAWWERKDRKDEMPE